MSFKLRSRSFLVVRVLTAILWFFWLISILMPVFSSATPLIYLIPALSILSFLLVDHFATFVIAILSCAVVGSIYPNQLDSVLRFLMMCFICATAIAISVIRISKQPRDKIAHSDPIPPESIAPALPDINVPTGSLSTNIRHDLRTPINLIIGFCDAIFRAIRTSSQQSLQQSSQQTVPLLVTENVEAIYRNAKQLEKLIDDLFPQLELAAGEKEEVEPAILIKETVGMLQGLMTTNGVVLDVNIGHQLPMVSGQRIYIRQILLNVLRSIVRTPNQSTGVTIEAQEQDRTIDITFTASSASVDQAVADASWTLSQRLVEKCGGLLSVETGVGIYGKITLSLSLSDDSSESSIPRLSVVTSDNVVRQAVIVMTQDESIVGLFREHIHQFDIIGINEIDSLRQPTSERQIIAAIVTNEEDEANLQRMRVFAGERVPTIACTLLTVGQQIERLKAVYLAKPVDYDALFNILLNVEPPIQNVLIIDDNEDSAEMLARMLTSMSHNYASRKAFTGREGLSLLNAERFDAIILDIFLPDIDGVELVQQIRSDARFANLPVVVVSAHQNLDSMLPSVVPGTISILQPHGLEPDKLVSQIGALINSLTPTA